jgi:hypothetical protein
MGETLDAAPSFGLARWQQRQARLDITRRRSTKCLPRLRSLLDWPSRLPGTGRRERQDRRHARSVTASIAGRTREAIGNDADRSGLVERLYTVVENDAEAGRFVTFAHSRLSQDAVAAVRRDGTPKLAPRRR